MDCSLLMNMTTYLLAQAQTGAGTVGRGISGQQYLAVAVAMAVLILPFVAGNFLARMFKMPNYGTRFGWILLAVTASVAVLLNSLPKLGVDLKGGTILVYEIDADKVGESQAEGGSSITSEDLVEPLTRRINPSGTQEIQIRPYGQSQIEIIVPDVQQQEVERIKGLVEEAGILRFAILANQVDHQPYINFAIEQAESPNSGVRTSGTVRNGEGQTVGFWANVDRELVDGPNGKKVPGPVRVNVSDALLRNPETGEILELPPFVRGENAESLIAKWIDDQGMKGVETLMVLDPYTPEVRGEDLAFAASVFDQNGAPAVSFTLTDKGSGKFFALTTNNAPVGSHQRQLGIVLDDDLLSAPNILQPIRKEGRITGRFTREEVDQLVQILKAGQLPAALTKQPIAENQIDATLGMDTIRKGVIAIVVSLFAVLLFILFYYRFPGIIACIALIMNLGMILATMVLINQPMTLPGLAGLVLTVGMSVDANVLIFERIREELKKGAAARMAIRNGFAKATVTIVDSNLTTLITAIVLYAIGTDQIRGFAVTLILGILFSMFTAIYVSRTLFDLAERHGFLSLSMTDGVNTLRGMISGERGVDFMGMGRTCMIVSGILMLIGIASLFARGRSILDIDFAGGSSVQFRLDRSAPTDEIRRIVKPTMVKPFTEILLEQNKLTDDQLTEATDAARVEGSTIGEALVKLGYVTGEDIGQAEKVTEDLPYTVNAVSMEGSEPGTIYKIDSSFARVDDLKSAIVKAFANEPSVGLVTYNVTITPASKDNQSRFSPSANGVMLAAAYPQDAATPEGDAPPAAAAGDTQSSPPNSTASQPVAPEDAPSVPSNLGPVVSSAVIELGIEGETAVDEDGEKRGAAISESTLKEALVAVANEVGVPLTERVINATPIGKNTSEWSSGSQLQFNKWKVDVPLPADQADRIMARMQEKMSQDPVWVSSSSVGSSSCRRHDRPRLGCSICQLAVHHRLHLVPVPACDLRFRSRRSIGPRCSVDARRDRHQLLAGRCTRVPVDRSVQDQSDGGCRDFDDHRLFVERHDRRLRPYP